MTLFTYKYNHSRFKRGILTSNKVIYEFVVTCSERKQAMDEQYLFGVHGQNFLNFMFKGPTCN